MTENTKSYEYGAVVIVMAGIVVLLWLFKTECCGLRCARHHCWFVRCRYRQTQDRTLFFHYLL